MIDALLRAFGLRTGRFTSPHLESMRERIRLDGEPIDPERFVRDLRRRGAVPRPGRRASSQASPAVVLRGAHGDGVRRVRRRPGRRGGRRGRPRRHLGRDQRRRRPGGGRDRRSPSTTPSSWATTSRRSPARRPGSSSPASYGVLAQQAARRPPRCCCAGAVEVDAIVAREGVEFGVLAAHGRGRRPAADAPGSRRRVRRRVPAAASARTRPRTRPSRWRRSRRSSGAPRRARPARPRPRPGRLRRPRPHRAGSR